MPNQTLLAYSTTKGAIQNFTGGLAQMLAEKGVRVNAVAPGPIWTPLIPSTMPEDTVRNHGKHVPFKRGGHPCANTAGINELAVIGVVAEQQSPEIGRVAPDRTSQQRRTPGGSAPRVGSAGRSPMWRRRLLRMTLDFGHSCRPTAVI
jgi:NAD(P)-dependent dehydrogenase (short-subunit alcohol dehydrogenase family)